MHFTFAYFIISDEANTYSDMDLSNRSHSDDSDFEAVSNNPAPQPPKSNAQRVGENDMKSTMPKAITEKPECISFHQKAIDELTKELVLQYLKKNNLSPETLTDNQLKSYIKYIIDLEYFKKNARPGSVESHVSVESSHSR